MKRPDVAAVMGKLKGFQRDTAEYAFQRLYLDDDSTQRFLVADEVGLGKTLVARGVIAKVIDHLWDHVPRIDIVYICSNANIARQNVNRLYGTDGQNAGLASRITLLPLHLRDLEKSNVNFISFTPGTSFELSSGTGVMRERVLLYWLLHDAWQLGNEAAPKNIFQGTVQLDRFREALRSFWPGAGKANPPFDQTLAERFRTDIEERVCNEKASGVMDLRTRFDALRERFARSKRSVPEEDRRARDGLIADLRRTLAKSCLKALQPDLIILDEFQRFRALLDGEDEAAELAHDLFSYADETTSARLLLLSATPYKMYTLAHEQDEDDHHKDFLRTVRFLTKKSEADDDLPDLLRRYREGLYALGTDGAAELVEVRQAMEAALRRVMARTERVRLSDAGDGMLREVPADVRLEAAEVRTFAPLSRVADELGQPEIVEYWKSSPYLLNFMEHYQLKRAFEERMKVCGPDDPIQGLLLNAPELLLQWRDVERYGEIDPANARLRSFIADLLSHSACQLLWLPPSAPYYRLGEPFRAVALARFTKRLVFSSWAVVPRVVAALASYEAERRIFQSVAERRPDERPENTAEARERRKGLLTLTRSDGRLTGMPVLALIYPSPTLALAGDPLTALADRTDELDLDTVLEAIERRLQAPLSELEQRAERTTEDETWYWAAPLLLDHGSDPQSTEAWLERPNLTALWSGAATEVEEETTAWAEHVDRARDVVAGRIQLGQPPKDLARVVALLALAGPANAALRSFGRLSGGVEMLSNARVRDAAARTGWAFRSLFNQHEAMAILRATAGDHPYWRLVLEYSARGCLASVIDEYVHVLRDLQGLFDLDGPTLSEELSQQLARVVGIRTGTLRLDEICVEANATTIRDRRMRVRFAMRFGHEKTENESDAIRDDLVRDAFNSPFWPFALVTTSVGQEGLDFHPYCHAVVHWNLPANPVDLEQREGRVHRFKGHAIRKNVAHRFASQALRSCSGDPWQEIFALASAASDEGDRGLSPFWMFPIENGAFIERHVPALPLSRDRLHLEDLRRSLAVYRMVFGQPRQDDLLAYLLDHVDRKALEGYRGLLQISLAPPRGGHSVTPPLS